MLNGRARFAASALAALATYALLGTSALAQVKTTYVSLGSGTQGILYEPSTPGDKARVALYIEHPYSSYMNFSACTQLATRGYRILCADGPFTNNANGYEGYDQMAPGIKAGITYLRGITGVSKVILMGHSMGAPMMAFYQNIAENGVATCQTADKFLPCNANNLRSLPKADGLVLLDAHLGDALATLTYVDPAIVDESRPGQRYKSLDMFDPANGYDRTRNQASYLPSFKSNFLSWQAERNKRLIASAQQMFAAINARQGDLYQDDMAFDVPGANGARLWQPDLGLLRQTKNPHTLLKADGTTPNQILVSVRPPSGKGDAATSFSSGALPGTVRTFLGAHAIRTFASYDQTVNDLTGIDYASSNTSTAWNVEGVTIPLLLICHTGHYFCRPDEIVLEHSASTDKTMAGNEGATHGITACTNCGGDFGDTVKREYDYLDGWLAARF